jgi:hypothetical protein
VPPLAAQPVINEFMASNLSTHPDNSDFDDYSDWIELHNPDDAEVSLAGHYLTDDLSQPFKWLIPGNSVIPANGYLMFRADGFDAAPGETRLRGYYPWASTFETRRFHAGFALSAEGEAIGLYRTELPPQDLTLVPAAATWKYLDEGTDPGAGWMTFAFDDAAWPEGPAPLGYGDEEIATVVSYGLSSADKYRTTHFRHRFNVTDPSRLGNIRFRVWVDDGAVLYLNGAEFARLRMPPGVITHTHFASAPPPSGNAFETLSLPRSLLRPGENLLAVEVHQISDSSSDLVWDAELIVAEITGPAILVDSVIFGLQTTDVSQGRDPSSTNGWSFFGSPTPEGPNLTEPLTALEPAPPVTATLDSGFYTNSAEVELSGMGELDSIRYTLDGSIPNHASPVYSNALDLSTNTILRARAFASGLIPGPVLTRSYFVDEAADRTLPVISFVADPATLFDNVIGIYSNSTTYPSSCTR